MPVDEYRKWMGFYLIEPFGDEWRQVSRMCSTMAGAFGGKIKEAEFMPTELSKTQSSADMEQALMAAMAGVPNG